MTRDDNDLLRTLIDHLPDLIYVKDLDSRTLLVNRALSEMLGKESPAELVGTTDFDTYPRELAERFFRCEQDILFAGTPMIDREAEIVDTDGRRRVVLSTKVPTRDADGVPTGLVGIARDITARKEAEEKLNETLKELSRSNQELEQFAYAVSHDLQEPLRQVASFVQLLERHYADELGEKGKRFIGRAVEGAQRMHQQIQDLLAYSRLGRPGAQAEEVDLEAVLGTARRHLSQAVSESQAEVVVVGELPSVSGDRARLVQLMQNLLGNAIKFRQPGVTPRVELRAQRDGEMWRVTVADNGIGIQCKEPERVFQIFQRLHTASEYPGTGIGLTLCRRVVESHGGKIWYDSQQGEGTTFTFTLPMLPARTPG